MQPATSRFAPVHRPLCRGRSRVLGFPRSVLQQIEEFVPWFEDAGVVGEEEGDNADEELL